MNRTYCLSSIFVFFTAFISAQNSVQDSIKSSNDTVLVENKVRLNWMQTYDAALDLSKQQKKPVMIYFTGSDWCAPCIQLDRELFYTKKFKDFSDQNLIMLEVDIPRQQDLLSDEKMSENLYLKQKYKVNSFPTLLFVNHKGKVFAEKKGYILTEYYFPYIQNVVYDYKKK